MKTFTIIFYASDENNELKPIARTQAEGETAHGAASIAKERLIKDYPEAEQNYWMAI